MIVCCDDTSNLMKQLNYSFIVLFGTNLSNELFEFAKAVKASTRDLKELLGRNVDAIFASD
jgi:hypothetical protein